jgi:hyperosmotically inducible periplasmic protein
MTSTRSQITRLSSLAAATFVALGLAACQPKPETPNRDQTVGQKVDGAIASAERKADEMKADAKQATAEVRADAKQAADTAGSAVTDAAITAAVNAKLAADPGLSALRINVDTSSGRVALSGDAPDAAARDRATTLASSVDGVVGVENKLTLQKKS